MADFLSRLDSGSSSLGTIQIEILAYRDSYVAPSADTEVDDDFIAKVERRYALGQQLENLLENIRAETDPEIVVQRGHVLTTAAALLSRQSEIAANYQVGNYLVQLNKCPVAVPFIERASTLYQESEDSKKKIPIELISLKLVCLEFRHRYDETEAYVRELLDHYGAEDFRSAHSFFYRLLASACLSQGKSDSAIEAGRLGLESLEKTTNRDNSGNEERANFQSIIGASARSSGRYDDAVIAFEASRKFARSAGDVRAAATALSEIGITWFQIGEEERGRNILEQAAKEAEQAGYPSDALRWRASLPAKTEPTADDPTIQILVWAAALLREDPPRAAEARRLAIICVQRAKEERDWRTELDARNCLAAAYSKEERHSQAIAAAREAVRLTATFGDLSREVSFRTNLGRCFYDAGRIGDAERELRGAIEKGKIARSSATTTEIRQAISGGMRNAYEILAVILAQSWEQIDGEVIELRTDKLLELLQETRAGNFAGWLAADNLINREDISGLHDPLLELRAADVRIEMESLSKGRELTGLLEAQKLARHRFAVATSHAGLNLNIAPPIYPTDQLQSALNPGECLVDLYGLLSHVLVTLLRPSGKLETFFVRWPEEERSEFITRWRGRVSLETAPNRKGRRLRRPLESVTSKTPTLDPPALEIPLSLLLQEFNSRFIKQLADALITPQIPSRLIIVPHHELSLLPFWALAEHLPVASISVVPGANVHKLISERRRPNAGLRLAIKDATETLDYAQIEITNLPGFEVLSPNVDEIMQALPRANILHCAGHGVFDDHNPYLSGVIAQRFAKPELGPFGARTPIFNEELLTVAEVLAETRLPNCYLVTLSACSTGLPRQHPANEFIGLPAAFLIAGAKNVIGSLWPVDDAATCLLMREFYDVLVKDNSIVSKPSTALASARDRLRQLRRSDIVRILGKDSDVIPDLEFPYAGPEYTLAFQHFGAD